MPWATFWATFWKKLGNFLICLFTLRHRLRRIRKPSSLSKLLIVKKPVAFSSKFLFFRSFWPSETFSEQPSLRLTVRLINLGSFFTFTGPRLCCFVPLPSFVALFRAFCDNRKKKWLRTERRRETPTWPSTSRGRAYRRLWTSSWCHGKTNLSLTLFYFELERAWALWLWT